MTAWKYKVKKEIDLSKMNFQGMHVKFMIDPDEMPQLAAYQIFFPENMSIPPSYHKIAYEIIMVQEGQGIAHLNDKKVPVVKGDVMLIKPFTWHSFSTTEHSMRLLAVTSPYVDNKTDLYHE